ncbi:MAG: hypothetical protein KME12_23540 [Trichocoleus desertorum ATA4-8-CV12]|jgi:hypothetical protein|nr:hypothetical protein [Trichocoleus desertorum ATA4-8-CV12]
MTRKNFRRLLVLSWLLVIPVVIVSFATETSLPPELQNYLERVESAPLANGEIVLATVNTTFIVFALVLAAGLFRFRRWAKTLLPMYYVLGLLLLPFNGPYVESGWATVLIHSGVTLDGVILALVFFSPLKESFETDGDV